MKSRDSSRGVFSPISAAWRWLWAPRKNPHAAEERENQRRREKRRRSTATAAASKTRITTKPKIAAQTTELAYVDKSGNVRLTDGGRVVARAGKGSKAAALADAKALYEQRLSELSSLETAMNAPEALVSELEGKVARLKNEIRNTPGLGDLEDLESRFSDLETALEDRTQEQWNHKRDIIARMEALSKAAPKGLGFRSMNCLLRGRARVPPGLYTTPCSNVVTSLRWRLRTFGRKWQRNSRKSSPLSVRLCSMN